MTPPPYTDLGKSAKNLFDKGYPHGLFKVDVTTKTDAGPNFQFKTKASHNFASQKLLGDLEIKYKAPEHGLTVKEKWNTDNHVSSIVKLNNKIARGLKVVIDTSYIPHNGKWGGILKAEWSGERVKINTDVTLFGGPLFDLAAVGQLKYDWLIGGQAKFDLASNELKTASLAIGRKTGDYTMHSFTIDGREFGASLYHQVHKNFEYGVQFGWKKGDQGVHWGLASKYSVNPELTFRAKLDNKSQVSLAVTHNLSDALKLTLATHFGLAGFPDAKNKFGIGLAYAP